MKAHAMNPWKFAQSLARPVARGCLAAEEADAAILVTCMQAMGWRDIDRLESGIRICRHFFDEQLERHEVRRDIVASRIRHAIKPMIAVRKRSNSVFAEAHHHNGLANFPLTEEEVHDVVRREMFFALPPAPRGHRHGR